MTNEEAIRQISDYIYNADDDAISVEAGELAIEALRTLDTLDTNDSWLIAYLEHQLEVLEQDISEQRMFGNNYLIGKRVAYNDIYKMLRGDE